MVIKKGVEREREDKDIASQRENAETKSEGGRKKVKDKQVQREREKKWQ